MAYPIEIKEEAIRLRELGCSLNEIHKELGVSKSILSGWLYSVFLDKSAKEKLLSKVRLGQLVSAEKKKEKIIQQINSYKQLAKERLTRIKLDRELIRILCSLIYFCEGTKNSRSGVRFTNSDSRLASTFLELFRVGFDIQESKLRVCLHLHEYHNKTKQLNF